MELPKTLKDVIKSGEDILRKNNIENSAYDSFTLISDILNIDRSYYFLHENDEVLEAVYNEYINRIVRRASHEPLQHIIGYTEFWKYRFFVNEYVLVPRQDTETLVEEALKKIDRNSTVLDMCTGSGCILISIALETNFVKGIGVDISKEALVVANKNAELLKTKNVEFLESDLFEKLQGIFNDKFDIIVSNPPYIKTSVIEELTEEVRAHDPMMALDGHDDGLYFYETITAQAVDYIKAGGWLIYEIGYDQAEDVKEILIRCGFSNIEIVKDLTGHDRVALGQKLN
ncbi:peptide chain release factor N(5)-glutamine methyltransferase [[Clostridium] fimetarium]|uniref:Release factor glutamine methyltransferase n=1 Tax=[Clostridium] fimetarium TaxID=99656 RepID=A0A1I0NMS7_9FIRM|nr:peptide chain release factor N(5)-glutamine methyltransferase [[Clostridium] fimetarium]SEW02608.1 release factor glutamine methyltransferase [[Clostridium] fimetarium]